MTHSRSLYRLSYRGTRGLIAEGRWGRKQMCGARGGGAVERGDRAVEDVIAALELVGALDGEEIRGLLDDADRVGGAAGVGAERARVGLGEREADRAEPRLVLHGEERVGELLRVLS